LHVEYPVCWDGDKHVRETMSQQAVEEGLRGVEISFNRLWQLLITS